MKKNLLSFMLLFLVIHACSITQEQPPANLANNSNDNRSQLEQAIASNNVQTMIQQAIAHAKATVKTTNIANINKQLRPYDHEYFPISDSEKPIKVMPTVLFFHGCSGPTLSHEQAWAKRFNDQGIAMIAPDSYSARGINWQDVCNMQAMTPWQRSADVLATIASVIKDPRVDAEHLYLAGFSHGALTLWATLVQGSKQQPPIGLKQWPDIDLAKHIKGVFLFYGTCIDDWHIKINTVMFLGDNDRYIDQSVCQNYLNNHPEHKDNFTLKIYPRATHTFDHQQPNQANIDAGSVYHGDATEDAWLTMLEIIKPASNHIDK